MRNAALLFLALFLLADGSALACDPYVQDAQNYSGYAHITSACSYNNLDTYSVAYTNIQLSDYGQPLLSYTATGANQGCFLTWDTDGNGANYGQVYIGQYPYTSSQQVSEGVYYSLICKQNDGTWYGGRVGPALNGNYVGPSVLE